MPYIRLYMLHRASCLGLALFLPFHFYVLSLALTQPERLDTFLQFAENPFVKIAVFGLDFGLAVHMFGGLRLLEMVWLPWCRIVKDLRGGGHCGVLLDLGHLLFTGDLIMPVKSDMERHDTDILILGTGGAGMFAALHARKTAPKSTIAFKAVTGNCGRTGMVQGAKTSLWASVTRSCCISWTRSTLASGCRPKTHAWKLCVQAVVRLRELGNEAGCFFDRTAGGSPRQMAFASLAADRTVHKDDLTGFEIINRLMEQVLLPPIEKLQEHRAIGLIPTKDGTALAGVLFIDMRTGKFRFVRAKAVMMGTGGSLTMIKDHTSSGDNTREGLAMALRAGLPLRDMKTVQFHPIGLLVVDHSKVTGTVLEEGLRGAGGIC